MDVAKQLAQRRRYGAVVRPRLASSVLTVSWAPAARPVKSSGGHDDNENRHDGDHQCPQAVQPLRFLHTDPDAQQHQDISCYRGDGSQSWNQDK